MFHRLLRRASIATRWGFIGSLLSLSPVPTCLGSGAMELQAAIQGVYQEHANAIVRVKVATEKPSEKGEPKVELLVISGFFINETGQVLTSYMPPETTTRVWIEQHGISYLADIVGADARTNLALLQVINLPKSFDHIEIKASDPSRAIGSFAFAITSPLDFEPTPKLGLVTGFENHFAEIQFPFTYTRLSIPLGPAEGGSPAFNMNKELIGVLVATLPEVSSSYIIPAKALARIVKQLQERQKVLYGVIPIEFEERTDGGSLAKSVLIKNVVPRSPAEQAGLRSQDKILSMDGAPVSDLNTLRDMIFFKNPGEFMLFKVKRGNETLDFAILLEPQEDHLPAASATPRQTAP